MNYKLILIIALLSALILVGCGKKQDAAKPDTIAVMSDSLRALNDAPTDEPIEEPTAQGTVGKNSTDEWIAGYEKVVVAYEKNAADGKLSKQDMAEINKKMADLSDKQKDQSLTPAQLTKLTGLITRLTKVIQKIRM